MKALILLAALLAPGLAIACDNPSHLRLMLGVGQDFHHHYDLNGRTGHPSDFRLQYDTKVTSILGLCIGGYTAYQHHSTVERGEPFNRQHDGEGQDMLTAGIVIHFW